MMNRETEKTYSDINPEFENMQKDRTDLQVNTEKTSGNFGPSDNMSDGVKSVEQTDTKEGEKEGTGMTAASDASGAKTEASAGDRAEADPADDRSSIGGDDENKSKEPSLEEKYIRLNDAHLRLMAEFDNFRKRTLREKADLIKSGGATVLTNLLPVIDDFERALSTLNAAGNITSVGEGIKLIYDKFMGYLSQQGVKSIEAIGKPFDTELFEAIAAIPAPEECMKGKVIDCVQTGYTLYDKVLRHAKVVVGE
jgi:molecular chaperone GrpE